MVSTRLRERTVVDFGEQWTHYTDNVGWYGSVALLEDVFGPLLDLSQISGRRVAEIGSGTGRIVHMLLEAGAAHVTAIEPSEEFAVLVANTGGHADRVRCLRLPGERLPADGFDYVFAVGVLHHIPEPRPVVAAAFRALRPDGVLAVWLYGREGNELYLHLVRRLRAVTTRLPHALLAALAWALTIGLSAYSAAARFLPLPLRGYMRQVVVRLGLRKRQLVVYDQLNPAYAKYYGREEARQLLAAAGFVDVRLHHRHGYSWAVVGRKPLADGRDAAGR